MSKTEMQDRRAAEQQFKQRLLKLGLLTRITPPPAASTMSQDRQPVPVAGNSVSETVMAERR